MPNSFAEFDSTDDERPLPPVKRSHKDCFALFESGVSAARVNLMLSDETHLGPMSLQQRKDTANDGRQYYRCIYILTCMHTIIYK